MVTMPVRNVRARRMPPAERREALINATLPLVLWHGPGVTTRQIAEAADVAEGTIFRVFPDKEALMRAVLAEAFDPEPTLRELAAVDRAQPLRSRLTAGVRSAAADARIRARARALPAAARRGLRAARATRQTGGPT